MKLNGRGGSLQKKGPGPQGKAQKGLQLNSTHDKGDKLVREPREKKKGSEKGEGLGNNGFS